MFCFVFVVPPDDLRQLNDKLVEVNTSKMALQMKLDELEAAEVNIKVRHTVILSFLTIRCVYRGSDLVKSCYVLLYMLSYLQITE